MVPTENKESAMPISPTPTEPSPNIPLETPQAEPSTAPIESSISQAAQAEGEFSAEEQAIAQAHDAATAAAVEQAQAEIEIDNGSDTTSDTASMSDAGYETDSLYSASTSLSSSVRDFAFENGRRYHKFREGAYNFPNDPSEQDREDMKHAMMVNLLGGRLHFAPIVENGNVLDMGTGTGIWAIES